MSAHTGAHCKGVGDLLNSLPLVSYLVKVGRLTVHGSVLRFCQERIVEHGELPARVTLLRWMQRHDIDFFHSGSGIHSLQTLNDTWAAVISVSGHIEFMGSDYESPSSLCVDSRQTFPAKYARHGVYRIWIPTSAAGAVEWSTHTDFTSSAFPSSSGDPVHHAMRREAGYWATRALQRLPNSASAVRHTFRACLRREVEVSPHETVVSKYRSLTGPASTVGKSRAWVAYDMWLAPPAKQLSADFTVNDGCFSWTRDKGSACRLPPSGDVRDRRMRILLEAPDHELGRRLFRWKKLHAAGYAATCPQDVQAFREAAGRVTRHHAESMYRVIRQAPLKRARAAKRMELAEPVGRVVTALQGDVARTRCAVRDLRGEESLEDAVLLQDLASLDRVLQLHRELAKQGGVCRRYRRELQACGVQDDSVLADTVANASDEVIVREVGPVCTLWERDRMEPSTNTPTYVLASHVGSATEMDLTDVHTALREVEAMYPPTPVSSGKPAC